MAIKKYSTFDQARRDQWIFAPDGDYYRQIRNFYRFATELNFPQSERGIFKYRSISDLPCRTLLKGRSTDSE